MNELDAAKERFATTYFNGVVGIEWEAALSFTEFMAKNFRYDGNVRNSNNVVASRLDCEACRYEDM